MTTPKQEQLIAELLEELDVDLPTALELADLDPDATLEQLRAPQASALIDALLEEKRARKEY
jgi:hypothetical protein